MGRVTVQDGRLFAYASEFPMEIMTIVGLVSGISVVSVMVLMGGGLHMLISEHAISMLIGDQHAMPMSTYTLSAISQSSPVGPVSGLPNGLAFTGVMLNACG